MNYRSFARPAGFESLGKAPKPKWSDESDSNTLAQRPPSSVPPRRFLGGPNQQSGPPPLIATGREHASPQQLFNTGREGGGLPVPPGMAGGKKADYLPGQFNDQAYLKGAGPAILAREKAWRPTYAMQGGGNGMYSLQSFDRTGWGNPYWETDPASGMFTGNVDPWFFGQGRPWYGIDTQAGGVFAPIDRPVSRKGND